MSQPEELSFANDEFNNPPNEIFYRKPTRKEAIMGELAAHGIVPTGRRSTGFRPPYKTPPPVVTSARKRKEAKRKAFDHLEQRGKERLGQL